MPWLPKQTVVVPIDFSDDSLAAVDVALSLVALPSDIRIVHVLADLTPLEPSDAWHTLDDQSRIAQVKAMLSKRLTKHGPLSIEVLVGDPGHRIADFAAAQQADLIVMPSHGRTGLAHMLIGSVAERVVRLAHCPVLVLRK